MPSFQCSDCGRMHTDWSQCAKRIPIGKVTGFEVFEGRPKCGTCKQEIRPDQISGSVCGCNTGVLGAARMTEISAVDYPTQPFVVPEYDISGLVEKARQATRLKVSEARAMERAIMLGFKIVVSPHLRGAETEIHVSQQRYDELKEFLPQGEEQ